MSEVFNTPKPEPQELENKFAIPVRYGLMTGFISMFLTTISFMYVLKYSFIAFGVFSFLSLVIPIVFYVIAGIRQRKAMGGYISIKEAFQVIFIVILISQLISAVYGIIYTKVIDPDCLERMKVFALALFEKMKAPQESIDTQMKNIDAQISGSLKPAKLAVSFAQSLIGHSIAGILIALIIKKERPVQQF